jgi:hypothetical protein
MSVRRLTAAVLLLVASSSLYVPACEYDQTRQRGNNPQYARETPAPAAKPA